jgi:hypothetical protein
VESIVIDVVNPGAGSWACGPDPVFFVAFDVPSSWYHAFLVQTTPWPLFIPDGQLCLKAPKENEVVARM